MKRKPYRRLSTIVGIVLLLELPDGIAAITSAKSSSEQFGTLSGSVNAWQRQRKRREPETGRYRVALKHLIPAFGIGYSSPYWGDIVGFELGGYATFSWNQSGYSWPSEIGISRANTLWADTRDNMQWDRHSSTSFYKTYLKIKQNDWWLNGGYLQPTGQTLISVGGNFFSGTYRGIETGVSIDIGTSQHVAFSYLWADQFKAPWYRSMYEFRRMDNQTKVDYLHSLGGKYAHDNGLMVEAAYGQAKGFMNSFFAKFSHQFPIAGSPLQMSYQFYGSHDRKKDRSVNDVFDGLAWLQGVTFYYQTGPVEWRLEGTWVRAAGSLGYFHTQLIDSYDSASGGRLDIDWDARSDFNAHGERSLYLGALYDLTGYNLQGWQVGAAYVYGWNGKPSALPKYDQQNRLKESALTADMIFTIPQGVMEGASFQLHYTRYRNHSDWPSFSAGFKNVFQSEHEINMIFKYPFQIF